MRCSKCHRKVNSYNAMTCCHCHNVICMDCAASDGYVCPNCLGNVNPFS
ncbi:MAG TPA: hypothetical protein P5087_03440 [Eubacteriales bacterium]|nr:hypothetical protein [Eubacteriales bacterium]